MLTINNRHVLILGGGISGNSAANLLKKRQCVLSLTDKIQPNPLPEMYDFFYQDTLSPGEILQGVDLIIKSPGISPNHPVLLYAKEKIPVLSELALGRIFYQGNLIGITGTDGKSTTTALTYHLIMDSFKAGMGGNIGTPFTAICEENHEIMVLELSSYQLEDSDDLLIDYAAILNFAPDHLERHGTLANYISAKMKLLTDHKKQILVTNKNTYAQMNSIKEINPNYTGNVLFIEDDARIDQVNSFIQTKNFTYDIKNFKLQGQHNLENLAAAILLAESIGCKPEVIQERIPTFTGLNHRFQIIRKINDTEFINDSKSTNLHSLISWLKDYPNDQKLILLIGGKNKGKDITELVNILQKKNVFLFLYGEATNDWQEQLAFLQDRLFIKENLEEIFKALKGSLIFQESRHVILSPACASFDQYRNFEERGNHFTRLVNEI